MLKERSLLRFFEIAVRVPCNRRPSNFCRWDVVTVKKRPKHVVEAPFFALYERVLTLVKQNVWCVWVFLQPISY